MAPAMRAHSFDYRRIAFDLIDELETLPTADAIVLPMGAVLAQFGYTSFLIASAPETVLNIPPVFLIDGWPRGWMERYSRENYFKDDPMVARCRQSVDPFERSEVEYDPERSPRAGEVMRRSAQIPINREMAASTRAFYGLDGPILTQQGLSRPATRKVA
jgi:LuxR family quorum sensing-dependent transcriptional regulator